MASQNNQVKAIIDDITKNINEDMKDFTPLRTICDKYGQQPAHVVLAIAAAMFLFTSFGLFGHTMVTLFGLVYPAYMTLQAIREESEAVATKWLTYWVVFGFLTAFNRVLSVLLFFVPGYYLIKVVLLAWMYYPRTRGAQIIYDSLLKPHLHKLKELSHKKHD